MSLIEAALALGVPLQINTSVTRQTLTTLPRLAAVVRELPIVLWAVYFLIQSGRGDGVEAIDAVEAEQVLNGLYAFSRHLPFGVKTTEAPHFRRVIAQREAARSRLSGWQSDRTAARAHGRRTVTEGNGIVFVDHVGNITPSGCLPIVRGNVRTDRLVSVYREDPLFTALRNPDQFHGRCGRCEFRKLCGGSRARAYAATGDVLGSDPLCAYQPAAAVHAPGHA
jgi:radical SAM protein with 4Fe4S-binding SPASM domain